MVQRSFAASALEVNLRQRRSDVPAHHGGRRRRLLNGAAHVIGLRAKNGLNAHGHRLARVVVARDPSVGGTENLRRRNSAGDRLDNTQPVVGRHDVAQRDADDDRRLSTVRRRRPSPTRRAETAARLWRSSRCR